MKYFIFCLPFGISYPSQHLRTKIVKEFVIKHSVVYAVTWHFIWAAL